MEMPWDIFLATIIEMEALGMTRASVILYLYKTGRGYTHPLTQKQCAEALGVSRATLQEIESVAVTKLREAMDGDNN